MTTNFTWDNNGNMLTKGSQTFTWDRANRLAALTNGSVSASYRYDGDGVRLGKTVDGVVTDYLQDQAAGFPVVLRETVGGISNDYVYGSDLIAANNTNWSFYHADGLGSTRMLTDESGIVTNLYSYDVVSESWSTRDWLFSPEGLNPLAQRLAKEFRNPAAHTTVLSEDDFLECVALVEGPQGILPGLRALNHVPPA